MKDPQRLLDDGAADLQHQLLSAGDAEGPSDRVVQATLAALGLGSAALTSSVVASAASGSAAKASSALATASLGTMTASKWVMMVAFATASAGAVGYWAWPKPPTRAEVSRPAPQVAPAPVPERGAPPLQPSDAPAAPLVSSPLAAPRPPVTFAERGPDVEAQIALIDRARAAAASGKPAVALAALDEYQKRFPRGMLAPEAMALRVEVLHASGDRAGAARLGRRFLELYPRSALSPRIRGLVAE